MALETTISSPVSTSLPKWLDCIFAVPSWNRQTRGFHSWNSQWTIALLAYARAWTSQALFILLQASWPQDVLVLLWQYVEWDEITWRHYFVSMWSRSDEWKSLYRTDFPQEYAKTGRDKRTAQAHYRACWTATRLNDIYPWTHVSQRISLDGKGYYLLPSPPRYPIKCKRIDPPYDTAELACQGIDYRNQPWTLAIENVKLSQFRSEFYGYVKSIAPRLCDEKTNVFALQEEHLNLVIIAISEKRTQSGFRITREFYYGLWDAQGNVTISFPAKDGSCVNGQKQFYFFYVCIPLLAVAITVPVEF